MAAPLLLSIAYSLVGALVLLLCLRTRWPVAVKGGLIILLSGFYLVTYTQWQAMTGWPSRQAFPEQFDLLSARVVEPAPARGEAGAIYLWIGEAGQGQSPRAHVLPYDKALHAELLQALVRLGEGRAQRGQAAQAGDGSRAIHFEDRPRPTLPPKH